MSDVDGQEGIFVPFPVAFPQAETAIIALPRLQYLYVACKITLKRFRRRHVLCLECIQHVTHGGDRDHSRRDLLRAGVWIICQVKERIGKFLK